MASSSLPLRLHPPLPPLCGFQNSSKLHLIPFQVRETSSHSEKRKKKIHILCCSNQNSSSSSSWEEREEKRWEREEQRWLREEQRWIREESRWNSEKESLHQEIADLKFRIQTLLERRNSMSGGSSSTSDVVSNMATIFPVEMNRIAESSGSSGAPLLLDSESEEVEVEEEVKEMIEIEKEVRVSERSRVEVEEEEEEEEESKRKIVVKKKKKKALKMGAEGEEVRLMQEALQKLGFYSGEEDIEYSSFSSGTERAVKTWQASIDVTEDGIVTEELLERLMVEEDDGTIGLKKINEDIHKGSDFVQVDGNNRVSAAIDNSSPTYTEAPRDRVFLLGENRWEDPSRLITARNKQGVMVKPTTGGTKCITCRGEGRLLCLECDGTGEPNIEEQFMDWVDEEEAKCPYCEGLGYSICDVCEGNPLPL